MSLFDTYGQEAVEKAVEIARAGKCPRDVFDLVLDPDVEQADDPHTVQLVLEVARIAGVRPGDVSEAHSLDQLAPSTPVEAMLLGFFPGSKLIPDQAEPLVDVPDQS